VVLLGLCIDSHPERAAVFLLLENLKIPHRSRSFQFLHEPVPVFRVYIGIQNRDFYEFIESVIAVHLNKGSVSPQEPARWFQFDPVHANRQTLNKCPVPVLVYPEHLLKSLLHGIIRKGHNYPLRFGNPFEGEHHGNVPAGFILDVKGAG